MGVLIEQTKHWHVTRLCVSSRRSTTRKFVDISSNNVCGMLSQHPIMSVECFHPLQKQFQQTHHHSCSSNLAGGRETSQDPWATDITWKGWSSQHYLCKYWTSCRPLFHCPPAAKKQTPARTCIVCCSKMAESGKKMRRQTFINSFIHYDFYISPLQGDYSEALPTPVRLKRKVFGWA